MSVKFVTAFLVGLFAQFALAFEVMIPGGVLTVRSLAVPMSVKLDGQESVDSTLSISSSKGSYMVLEFGPSEQSLVGEVRTRVWASANDLTYSLESASGRDTQRFKFESDQSPQERPERLPSIKRKIGDKLYTYTDHGEGFRVKGEAGNWKMMAFNSGSKVGFIRTVTLDIFKGDFAQRLTVYGSPNWFEPYIGLLGDFDRVEVVDIDASGD